jgi:hypothetical protein
MPVTKGKEPKTTKRGRGRPHAVIDKQRFEDLCHVQCTQAQICDVLGIDHKTLNKWCVQEYGSTFQDVFAVKREGGLTSLRMTQFRMAETIPTMAIWLGKQYLNQSDDPRRAEKGEAVENRIGAFLDALTNAVGGNDQRKPTKEEQEQMDKEVEDIVVETKPEDDDDDLDEDGDEDGIE